MARSRIIKPEMWLNEELAETSIWARYLFPALWCHADREGRLEYRPKKLKAEIFPYDDVDIEKLIRELQDKTFLVRFLHEQKLHIQIANFTKHQHIHPNEKSSEIPHPDKCQIINDLSDVPVITGNYTSTPVKAPLSYSSSCSTDTSTSTMLTIVNSQTPPSSEVCVDEDAPIKNSPEEELEISRVDRVPYQFIAEEYNSCLTQLPGNKLVPIRDVKNLTATRKSHIRARWRNQLPNTDAWEDYFVKIHKSDFLMGRICGRDGKYPQFCDFDWIIKEANCVKILEGKYDNK